jgi:PBP1b-binding outer membrane lipoprotein LpoB
MKRLILLAAVAVMSTGCVSVFLSASDVANRVELGMSLSEFKRLAGQHAELDSMSPLGSVYRIDKHNIGIPDYVVSVTLYHFDANGRLKEVETRHLAPPYFPDNRNFEPLNP